MRCVIKWVTDLGQQESDLGFKCPLLVSTGVHPYLNCFGHHLHIFFLTKKKIVKFYINSGASSVCMCVYIYIYIFEMANSI